MAEIGPDQIRTPGLRSGAGKKRQLRGVSGFGELESKGKGRLKGQRFQDFPKKKLQLFFRRSRWSLVGSEDCL